MNDQDKLIELLGARRHLKSYIEDRYTSKELVDISVKLQKQIENIELYILKKGPDNPDKPCLRCTLQHLLKIVMSDKLVDGNLKNLILELTEAMKIHQEEVNGKTS